MILVLFVTLPGGSSLAAIQISFPEHVTVRPRDAADVEHLYLYRAGLDRDRPAWKHVGDSLQYERELPKNVHMLARATLQRDGVLFH